MIGDDKVKGENVSVVRDRGTDIFAFTKSPNNVDVGT
jgi:hypothetical protein